MQLFKDQIKCTSKLESIDNPILNNMWIEFINIQKTTMKTQKSKRKVHIYYTGNSSNGGREEWIPFRDLPEKVQNRTILQDLQNPVFLKVNAWDSSFVIPLPKPITLKSLAKGIESLAAVKLSKSQKSKFESVFFPHAWKLLPKDIVVSDLLSSMVLHGSLQSCVGTIADKPVTLIMFGVSSYFQDLNNVHC